MLGVHLPGTDFRESAKLVRDHGLECCQVLLGSPRRAEIQQNPPGVLKSFMPKIPVAVHGPFVINVCSGEGKKARMSMGILKGLMRESSRVGAKFVVIHAGSGPDWYPLLGAYRYMLKQPFEARLLIENDCGSKKGTRVGSVKNLLRARKELGKDESGKWRMGIVYDTAHAYANDELLSPEQVRRMRPDLIHLNEPDPNVEPGGHLDRHKTVFGEGRIGLDHLVAVARVAVEDGIPTVIEQDLDGALESLRRLRSALGREHGQSHKGPH